MEAASKRAERQPGRPLPSLAEALAMAAAAPLTEYTAQPVRRETLRAAYVLPLHLCPPTNRTRGAMAWIGARLKAELWGLMGRPLSGLTGNLLPRPQVICTRFSSVEPDKFADWAKLPVDMLCEPKGRAVRHRLGFLLDDSPANVELHQLWTKGAPRMGFVVIEVRS